MPFSLPDVAARLRRSSLTAAAASVLALALPAGAQAADSLGAGGVVIPGSALVVGVSGATNTAGSLQARFSAVGSPLFWGVNTSNMNDGTAAVFALNTPSGLYSAQSAAPVDNAPFTQTQAPALTGTGTVGDPYVVISKFDANAGVHITQTITHVSGETKFKATWAVTNATGSPSNFQGFEGADMYVNGNDNGTGTKTGITPNRVIGSVASDGTQGQIIEQSVSPWTHYFSGMNTPFYNATGDSTYGSFPDLIDATYQDSGEGVEWDFTLANGATKTMSVVWNFTHPAQPQAPQITGGVPAANAKTQATTANPAFTYAVGDSAQVVGYQCAIDGGSFTTCASPKALSGLADGSHTFSVRAINSAGDPGPQTDRTWTVDTTPPGAPTLTGAPTGTVHTTGASITLTGEAGATFRCSVDGGSYVGCSSPLVLTGLADGNHTVSVKQVDTANNTSTLVGTASWTVDTTTPPQAPSVTGLPTGDTNVTTAAPAFAPANGDTLVAGYECSLDGAAFAVCTSPASLTGLGEGTHTYKVRAVNAGGYHGPATTTTWTVDTTLPSAPVLGGAPTGVTADDDASITLTGENGATFRCSVDGGAFAACASPLVLTGLADGEHVVKVKQVDAAGNVSATATTASWTVDTTTPAPVDVAKPADTTATVASLAFETPAGMTAECSLDDASWQACASPVAVADLQVGTHTMRVRMINAAGTVGSVQTVTWAVKAPAAPTTTTTTTPKPPATTAPAKAIVPPSCVSRRAFTIHWAMPGKAKAKGFKVLVDGKAVKTLAGKARAYKVSLTGRPAARVRVEVRAIGAKLATTRVYKTCAAKPGTVDQPGVVLKRVA